jgi:hypothetical protein
MALAGLAPDYVLKTTSPTNTNCFLAFRSKISWLKPMTNNLQPVHSPTTFNQSIFQQPSTKNLAGCCDFKPQTFFPYNATFL